MVREIDLKKKKDVKELAAELRELSQKKSNLEAALAKHKFTTERLFELNSKSKQLFDNLLSTWHQDKEFSTWIEREQLDAQNHVRQVNEELASKREKLIKEKQQLTKLEDELYTHKRLLLLEEEQ